MRGVTTGPARRRRPATAWSCRSAAARSAPSPAPDARAAGPAEIDLATDAGAGVEQPVARAARPGGRPRHRFGRGPRRPGHGAGAIRSQDRRRRRGDRAQPRPAPRTAAPTEQPPARAGPAAALRRCPAAVRRCRRSTPTRCGWSPRRTLWDAGTQRRQSPHLAGLHPAQAARVNPLRPGPPRCDQRRPGAGHLGPGQPGRSTCRRRYRPCPGARRRCLRTCRATGRPI